MRRSRQVVLTVLVGALAAAVLGCGARARPQGDGGDAGEGDGGSDGSADGDADEGDASGEDCDALREALTVAFEAAVLCDPSMSSLQCTDEHLIRNYCGCSWAANNRHPDLAAAALEAWEAYEAGGCVRPDCPPCREPTPTFGCVILPIGTDGTCEIVG